MKHIFWAQLGCWMISLGLSQSLIIAALPRYRNIHQDRWTRIITTLDRHLDLWKWKYKLWNAMFSSRLFWMASTALIKSWSISGGRASTSTSSTATTASSWITLSASPLSTPVWRWLQEPGYYYRSAESPFLLGFINVDWGNDVYVLMFAQVVLPHCGDGWSEYQDPDGV